VRILDLSDAAGERHTSGTDSGMVAVVVEGEFETELLPA